jgi:hypothetical protein
MMSEDESMVVVCSLVASLTCWVWWYGATLTSKPSPVAGRSPAKALLLATPVIALTVLIVILQLWSASDVRDDGRYLMMYSLMGFAWTGVASFVPTWMGISFRHDVLIRGNHSASWVLCGWILGVMLAFSGANIGNGPGWWVVFFSAMLGTGTLTLIYFLFEKFVHANDAITIDRDIATGLRMLALFVSCGAVFGVSAAGDWVSADETVKDFLQRAWPAIPIFLIAQIFQVFLGPSPANPKPPLMTSGVLPALLILAIGFAWVILVGLQVVGEAV